MPRRCETETHTAAVEAPAIGADKNESDIVQTKGDGERHSFV